MKRLLLTLVVAAAALLGQGTSALRGTLKDDAGKPVSAAVVTAYSQSVPKDGGFPAVFNAQTGADGSFDLNGLTAGTYTLCVQGLPEGLLDPCFWSETSPTQAVANGATVSGVALVAETGVAMNIKLLDPQRLLADADGPGDILVGIAPPGNRPFIPALTVSKDSTGRTLRVTVAKGRTSNVSVHAGKFQLADDQNTPYTPLGANVVLPAQAVEKPNTPALIIRITGLTAGQ